MESSESGKFSQAVLFENTVRTVVDARFCLSLPQNHCSAEKAITDYVMNLQI